MLTRVVSYRQLFFLSPTFGDMIDIKDTSSNTPRFSTKINEGNIYRYTLMKEEYILLKFSVEEPVYFRLGDYVDIPEGLFEVVDLVFPVYNKTTGGYDYDLRLDAHYWKWKHKILFYDRQKGKEAKWSLTQTPDVHLSIVTSNLASLGYTYKGKPYVFSLDATVEIKTIFIQYDSTNIIDAITEIAKACDCEWWVKENYIFLGRCEDTISSIVPLEIGNELSDMSRSDSTSTYATRIYAFGSDRNIPKNYRPDSDDVVIEGVVQKRLKLPEGIPYIDAYPDMSEEEAIESVLFFDQIHPKRIGTLSEVVKTQGYIIDDNDQPTGETYPIFTIKDAELKDFKEEYVLNELRLVFQSGRLNGLDFAVELKTSDSTGTAFEIVRNEDYGQYLPNDVLKPSVDDTYILHGYDISFVSDTLIGEAEQELLRETQKYVEKSKIDPSVFTCPTDPVKCAGYINDVYHYTDEIDLPIGRRVKLINPAFFKDGRVSRIYGFEKKLDNKFECTYTVGESTQYSRIGEIENRLDELKYNGNTYVPSGSGGSGVYVIKTNDPTPPTDQNVYSALMTDKKIQGVISQADKRFLRKDINDTEKGFITFEKGFMTQSPIRSAEYNIGWEEVAPKGFYITETGTGWFTGVNIRGPLLCNDIFGSPHFASGWTGFGTQLDFKKSALELDFLTVRKSAKFYELVVNQIRGTNGSLAVTDTNQIETVEEKGDVWRCTIDDMDGRMYMNLRPGDVIRSQKWAKTSSRYYMARVTAVGDNWFEVDKILLEGEDAPAPKDVVVRWSNLTDEDRKGLLYLTSSDSYNPYMDIRYGDWNATIGTIKVRLGRLDGINDPLFPELYGARNNFGLYTTNFYGTGELILRSTGESVSRTFEVLKDSMTMGFNELREEVYVSPDNILQNATFLSESLDYWETPHTIYPYTFGSDILIVNGSLFSNVVSAAQLVSDELNNRQVLQVSSALVRQRNANFNSREAGKYAISFSYRPIVNYGALTVGIENSDLKITVPLRDTSKWQRAEITGDWDGTGDFIIEAVGGIANIVDISFADDRLTNTISKLKVEYDTKLSMKADGAELTSFRSEYDEFNREVRRDYATQSWTANKIKSEVGTEINGKLVNYSTITQTSNMIENKIANLNLGQYATTTWTSNQIKSKMESYVDGELTNYSTTTQTSNMIENKIVDLNLSQYMTMKATASLINLSIKNKADKSELTQTAEDLTISFTNQINSVKGIADAFYEFSSTRMRLNRRIELGTGSNTSFRNTAGMSPDSNDPAFWAGNTGGDPLLNSRIVLNHDGSGWLASRNIIWEYNGQLVVRGSFETATDGYRIVIDPSSQIGLYSNNSLLGAFHFDSSKRAELYLTDTSGNQTVVGPAILALSKSGYSGGLSIHPVGNTKYTIASTWPSSSEVGTNEIYKDTSGYLRVK